MRRGKRRRRRDRGSFQVSERDLELLGLIAEQYAITLDQLARLIGRTLSEPRAACATAGATPAGHKAHELAVDLPPFVWLTRRGSRLDRLPVTEPGRPIPGLATHIEAVTNVRLLLDRELQIGEWECERTLAQRSPSRSQNRPHLPDAVLTCPERIAIEVELNLKSRARLELIIEELSLEYDSVWYFAPDPIRPKLFELAQTAPYQNVTDPPLPCRRRRLAASPDTSPGSTSAPLRTEVAALL